MLVPVFERHTKGHPAPDAPAIEYGPLADALSIRFEWDAHFAAYSVPAVPHRLTLKSLGHVTVQMVLFVVDVEPEGHAPRTTEWDAGEAPKIMHAIRTGAHYYETRGGYRLLWPLTEPFIIASEHDAAKWSASYLDSLDTVERTYGIVGDRTCKDWGRLYRLPHVTRDGVYAEAEQCAPEHPITWTMRRIDVPEPKPLTAVPDYDDAEPASAELIEHVRARLKQHGPAISGQGGNEHTFKACAMVVRGYALNETDAVAVLSDWNAENQPPWDGDELRQLMDNAHNYGQGTVGEARAKWESDTAMRAWGTKHGARTSPASTRSDSEIKPTPKQGGVLGALMDLAPDWVDILAGNIAVACTAQTNPYGALYAHAKAEVEAYNGDASTPQTEEMPFFESAETLFAKSDEAPPKWLVESLLLEGGIGMIGAEPKAAKTWLGTELAVAIATGTPAMGQYRVVRPCGVAYFYTEDMRAAIKARGRALLAGRGLTTDALARNFHAQPRGRRIDVTRVEDCARIMASVRLIEQKHGKIGLVVLDPLRNIHMHDEDKSGEMAGVFEALKMIGTLLDVTVLIVHHSKKQSQNSSKRGGQRLRGSSAIHGFLDSALYLSETKVADDGSTFTNTVESETKSGRSAGTFELTLKIEDDANTRMATKAEWEIGRKGETNASEEEQDTWEEVALDCVDMMVQAEARRQKLATVKEIRAAVKTGMDTVRLALKLAVQRGWLRQDYKTKTYAVTPPGREISKARHRMEDTEAPKTGAVFGATVE